MQIYTAAISDAVTTAPSLNAAYIGHPEILERVTQRICNEYQFYFTGMALGYGRYITEGEVRGNNKKLTIGNDNITWAVRPRLRQLVTAAVQVNSGTGASNAPFTLTLSAPDNWIAPGMLLKYTDGASGTYITLYVISGPVANSVNWNYSVSLINTTGASTPFNIPVAATLGFTSIGSSTCTVNTTYLPKKFYDIYRNYNTTMKPFHTLCKDGIATVTWFISRDGQKCWLPEEHYQFEMESLFNLETGIIYNQSSVDANGNVFTTDSTGAQVMMGSGLLEQITSGNNITYNINTYYNNPVNYEQLRLQIKEALENWGIFYGINSDMTMYFHCGRKAYGLLQDVFKGYADQSGGCCFIMNYRNGKTDELELNTNITRYKFANYTIVLLNCAVFDNPGFQGTAQTGVTFLPPSLESFRFIAAPDTDCEGNPLLQIFFRGGCGLDDVWNGYYQPGTIDPFGSVGGTFNNGFKAHIAVSTYSGYNIGKEVEYVLVNRDNTKWLNFTPYQA